MLITDIFLLYIARREALTVAKENLHHNYQFVGILERLPASLKALESIHPAFNGITRIRVPHERSTAYSPPSKETKLILERILDLDMELYIEALKLFETKFGHFLEKPMPEVTLHSTSDKDEEIAALNKKYNISSSIDWESFAMNKDSDGSNTDATSKEEKEEYDEEGEYTGSDAKEDESEADGSETASSSSSSSLDIID